MGKSVNIAKKLADRPDATAKAGELLNAGFTDNALRNPPSLQALKLQDMLMKAAGGKIAEETWHTLPLADFKLVKGFRNLTHNDVVRLFEELRGVTMRHVSYAEGYTAVYGMISVGRVDIDEGKGKLRYKFDDEFRRVIKQSDFYGVLDYRAGLAMKSRYAHRLHEMIAIRRGLDKNTERFTVEELRARLGVQTGKLARWPDLKKYALDKAISEVNQSSRFTVSYRVTKRVARATSEVELAWVQKPDQEDTKKEQAAHSVARAGRRAEAQALLAFPDCGRIYDTTIWVTIKQDAGCNMDNGMIADKFRQWCSKKGIKLDAKTIDKAFFNYCNKVGKMP